MQNLVDILKQVPVGTKLWSNIFGDVELANVAIDDLIRVQRKSYSFVFYKDGRYFQYDNSECTLWPSKDHRAWDTEALYILGIEKKYVYPFGFQPFDRVLVRNYFNEKWRAEFFSHIENNSSYNYVCIRLWKYCIPYNDETKHLLGTTQMPPEKYRQ